MANKDLLIQWLMDEGIVAKKRMCPVCSEPTQLTKCADRSDGLEWECRHADGNGKRQKKEVSVQKESWFEKSHKIMTLKEIVKFAYW